MLRRFPLYLLFPLFLCTCTPGDRGAAVDHGPLVVTGSLRYQEVGQVMDVALTLTPATEAPPSFAGTALPPLPQAGPGNYKLRDKMPFPTDYQLQLPCGSDCDLSFNLLPPFVDSLPRQINKNKTAKFVAGTNGLADNENLVLFFEPTDRSTPRRLLIQGPTSSGTVTLPAQAMVDLAPGGYDLYLIKQQLQKDSTTNLRYSLQAEYFTAARRVRVTE